MAKKEENEFETPDYEAFKDVQEIDEEIAKTKDLVCRKSKMLYQTRDAKKEAVGAYNEQLKELDEEIDHSLGVLDELNNRRKVLEKGSAVLRSV